MTAPILADGDPYDGAVAVMDESAHEAGAGIYYNLTVVRIPEPAGVLPGLGEVVGDRPRPFHLSEEGPDAIERMTDLIESAGLVGTTLWSSVARTGQVAARRYLLREHALRCAADGVDHLSIEGGGDVSNQRDRSVILDTFRGDGGVPFRYDWRSQGRARVMDSGCSRRFRGGASPWWARGALRPLERGRPDCGRISTIKSESPGSCPRRPGNCGSSGWHSGTYVFGTEQHRAATPVLPIVQQDSTDSGKYSKALAASGRRGTPAAPSR